MRVLVTIHELAAQAGAVPPRVAQLLALHPWHLFLAGEEDVLALPRPRPSRLLFWRARLAARELLAARARLLRGAVRARGVDHAVPGRAAQKACG